MYIPYGRQNIDEDDIQAVVNVLRSDFITQGPVVPQFESAVAQYCGAQFAFAVNSATSALHIACLALGVGPGDTVWTTPITFVASANCALYCGASVDFVDIDPVSYNISVSALEAKLVQAEQNGTLPKVVIPVHLCGQSCGMQAIHALSRKYGFSIIEDASHAIGGRYQGHPVGSCQYSDIVVFSFHPVKIITSGEGGMALTNSAEIGERLARLRSHGITRDVKHMVNVSDGPWYYEQVELGFNYRMTDIQAALGLSQFQKLDAFVTERNALALKYNEMLEGLPVKTPTVDANVLSAFHLYVVRLSLPDLEVSHPELFSRMRADGIGVNLHYIPVYRQPYFARFGFNSADFPNAEKYYAEAITLPLYPGLSAEHQKDVVKHLMNPKAVVGYQTLF